MLRDVKQAHVKPLLSTCQVTTELTPLITLDIGTGDFESATRNAAGSVTLTKHVARRRAGIIIGTPGLPAANGAYFSYETDPATTTLTGLVTNAAGSGVDQTMDILCLDYQSLTTDRYPSLKTLYATSNANRMIAFKLFSDGTLGVGGRSIVNYSKTSTGNYSVSFRNAFKRTPLVFAMTISNAQTCVNVRSKTAETATFRTMNSGETAADNGFYCLVVGSDSRDDVCRLNNVVGIEERRPRVEACRVVAAGTVSVGSGDVTVVKNGTGDYSVTYTKAFSREPVAIATAKASSRCTIHSSSTTTFTRVLVWNATGSAADDDFCLMTVGFDDATEF